MPSKYERVAEYLREKIRTGEYEPGERLPSYEQIRLNFSAERGEVSYGPVLAAVRKLKDEGLIRGEPGVGLYVTEGKT